MQPLSPTSPLSHRALGLGLRRTHYDEILNSQPELDYFEIISENFMGSSAHSQRILQAVAKRFPIVPHGVGLNLLGHEPLREDYLDSLCRLADAVDAPFVSDHLCWTGAHGQCHHDLLPTPFTRDLVGYAAERAAQVQFRLQRPLALENLSSYVQFAESEMSEWDFYIKVVRQAGVRFMLDINNVYVSSQNHGFDPKSYIDAIDFSRVVQVHIAGHERLGQGPIIDTHDHPVADAVWDLYRYAWQRGGPFPTLLEWDDKIPTLEQTLKELYKARSYQS